jgi:hypothetical protein
MSTGTILCRLAGGSRELGKLCKKLQRIKTDMAPLFYLKERPTADRNIPYPDDKFFKDIYTGHPFSLDIELCVYEGEESRIYVQLSKGGKGLIGGFPRCLVQGQYSPYNSSTSM